jgi:Ca2+-binding RTX toxin-like protein
MAIVKGTNVGETIEWGDGVTDSADIIFGFGGNDILSGHGGNDILKGGGGADELHGGAGSDWADYSDSTESVDIDLFSGDGHGGTAEGDTFWSIENVSGSAHGDMIEGDNAVNQLYGAGGSDSLTGRGGGDYLDGGAGVDTAGYHNSAAAVYINLSAGTAHGGDAEGDTLVSIEALEGSKFDDQLWGNDENNQFAGLDGNDTLKGYGGNDWLMGNAGVDTMIGGTGDDHYYVGEAGDAVIEWADGGLDDVVYASISYTLPDNVETLALTEGNPLTGIGNALGNKMLGNDGPNVINGMGGQDRYWGNGGGDFFVWSSTSHTGVTEATADRIMDFSYAEGDKINFSGIDADVYAGGNQAFTFIGTNAFSGTPGEVNYYHSGGNTYIQMQTGTSPDVEAVIRIDGIVTPQANWFVL